jgi:hypothetical protein
LDPLVPPTITPTFTPTLTPTPGPSLTPTITQTPMPTTTLTPAATNTSNPTLTQTSSPTPTFTPTPVLAYISTPGGSGINLRESPGGIIITYLPVMILYRRETFNNREWIEVRNLLNQTGWVPAEYLIIRP